MPYLIRVIGLISGETSEDQARYLCRLSDPVAGLNFLSTTPDPVRALLFDSPEEAFEFWQRAPVTGFEASIGPAPSCVPPRAEPSETRAPA